jgi:molecular chaperone HtpG
MELHEYQGKQLQSVAKGEVDLGKLEDAEEKAEQQKNASEAQDLVKRLKQVLGEQVKDVRITTRLTNSPACLVADEYDLDPTFQRLLKATGQTLPPMKRILEINPAHPLILKLKQQTDEQRFADWAYVLYDQSILSLGEQLENPTQFVNRLNDLLAQL